MYSSQISISGVYHILMIIQIARPGKVCFTLRKNHTVIINIHLKISKIKSRYFYGIITYFMTQSEEFFLLFNRGSLWENVKICKNVMCCSFDFDFQIFFLNTQVIFIMLWKINKNSTVRFENVSFYSNCIFYSKHGLLNIFASRIKSNIQDFIVLRKPV